MVGEKENCGWREKIRLERKKNMVGEKENYARCVISMTYDSKVCHISSMVLLQIL